MSSEKNILSLRRKKMDKLNSQKNTRGSGSPKIESVISPRTCTTLISFPDRNTGHHLPCSIKGIARGGTEAGGSSLVCPLFHLSMVVLGVFLSMLNSPFSAVLSKLSILFNYQESSFFSFLSFL